MIRIVRLGTPRARDEGVRIGTVRRPPRGVARDRFAAEDWYDVWLPNLSPTAELLESVRRDASAGAFARFSRRFLAEMKRPEAGRILDTLAALSHSANFSVGCYCEDESRCHRSLLRKLFEERGAKMG